MSLQSEKAVIGCILLDNNALDVCYSELSEEMFSSKVHGYIYKRTKALRDNNRDINGPSLVSACKCEQLSDSKLADLIKDCVDNTITSGEVRAHIDNIIADYRSNTLKTFLKNKIDDIFPATATDVMGEIINRVEGLMTNEKVSGLSSKEMVKRFSQAKFKERKVKKVNTGIKFIDRLLGGLDPGDVIVIAARPAVGKSALVTQIAANMAKQKKKVGYYNLEMTEEQVYDRMLAFESGISHERIRNAIAFLGDEEMRFQHANEVIESYNMEIFSGKSKVSEIKHSAKHLGLDVIIIDYLQLIRADRENGSRATEVGYISKAIKELAKELNIPVILLSQLNRVSEGRETKEPTMAELRESGDIEQDASVVILLWNLTEDRIKKGCKVDKNRNGRFGKGVLDFNGEYMRFMEEGTSVKDYDMKQIEFETVEDEDMPEFT